jgi:hypothetical protein
VAIRDTVSGLWLNIAAGTWGAFVFNPATLDSPGATSSSWSIATPLGSGSYSIQARAVDAAGNQDATRATTSFTVDQVGVGVASVERWEGVSGTSLTAIANNLPSTSRISVNMSATGLSYDTSSDNFGARVRVMLTPSVTGDYRFWLATDDNGALLLNPNGSAPNGAVQIASVPGWTEISEWTKYSQQQSALYHLEAGTTYYLEMVFKEHGGGDHGAVAWQRSGGPSRAVIPASEFRGAGSAGAGGWRPGTPPT